MSARKGVLKFQQKEKRPPLTREQFLYWTDFLPKILKIGTEFEINLPSPERAVQYREKKGCVHAQESCAKDCLNLETCLVDRHPTFCLTRETGGFLGKKFECPAKSDADTDTCKTCPAWVLNCRGLNCAMHVPYCTTCPAFQRTAQGVESGDIRNDAETVRREMTDLLQPTGFVGTFGQHGVLEIKKDNSLQHNGGIEVPTVGRRVHWNSFYKMCKDIIDPIVARGGYVNERCGQHYHVLTGYFGSHQKLTKSISELEHSMPEIILANLHQLHRRYELAMFWIMSGGDSMEYLTRWARFRQPIQKYSALQSRMGKVKEELDNTIISMTPSQRGKYASVAYYFCRFDLNGDVSTFHIENRIGDGTLSPAVVTAWAMLCYALVMKAVRLSQYGIMEVGDREYCDRIREIEPVFINGQDRGWDGDRRADTSGIGPYIPWLRENAREMVQLLKSELSNLGPSYEILTELAEQPCSLRRVAGHSWEKIERDLYPQEEAAPTPGRPDDEIREIVDLAGVVDCNNIDVWIEEVAAYLGQEPPQIADIIYQMVESGEYRWSPPIGALITT